MCKRTMGYPLYFRYMNARSLVMCTSKSCQRMSDVWELREKRGQDRGKERGWRDERQTEHSRLTEEEKTECQHEIFEAGRQKRLWRRVPVGGKRGKELKSKWSSNLCTLSANATSQLNIFRHDGHTLGMDGAQVSVFEETDKVGLRGFLHKQRRERSML